MISKLGIQDLDLEGKRVLMRVDFNVPLDGTRITDDTRIRAALPSIRYVVDHGGKLILMSHLGRPKGKPNSTLSLASVAAHLQQLLDQRVPLAPDCVGPEVEQLVATLPNSSVLLLENLRFHPGEEQPETEPDFVSQLARLGDVYINDAFGTAHRAHASTTLIAHHFPQAAAAGFLMEEEMRFIGGNLLTPKRPFAAIIGGAKVSTKIGVLKALIPKVDALMIGGAMAYTFLKAEGIAIGESLVEADHLSTAREIRELCAAQHVQLMLPVDLVIATDVSAQAATEVIHTEEGIPLGKLGVDVGPHTIEVWKEGLREANTIFWNGPLGIFEIPSFARGTFAMAHVLAQMSAVTVIGGGDSVAAINLSGVESKITHICTGGGAVLEYIEFGQLPGIEALSEKMSMV